MTSVLVCIIFKVNKYKSIPLTINDLCKSNDALLVVNRTLRTEWLFLLLLKIIFEHQLDLRVGDAFY